MTVRLVRCLACGLRALIYSSQPWEPRCSCGGAFTVESHRSEDVRAFLRRAQARV